MLLVLSVNLNLQTLTDINTIATGSKMDGKGTSAAVTRTSQQTLHPVPVHPRVRQAVDRRGATAAPGDSWSWIV